MPKVKITSGKTGNQFTLNFKDAPTQADVDEALLKLEPESVAAPKESTIADQEAFKQQFIDQGTQTIPQQVFSALTAPVRFGAGLAKGLGETAIKGVQGVGSIYGKAAGQQSLTDLLKSYYGDVTQTVGEAGPRAVAEIANAVRQGFQSPQAAEATLRSATEIANPLQAALMTLIAPKAAPTPAQAQQNFEESLVNQAFAQQLEQPIAELAQREAGLVPAGTANIDVARAAPLLIGAETVVPAAIRGTAGLITSAIAPIQRAVSRSLPATVEQSAMAALDVTAEEAARHIPVINQRILEISPKAAAPKTAADALKRATEAEASLYQDALVADKAATQQGLAPRSDLIISNVEETLNNIPSLLAEERAALLNDARARYTDVSTPAKGRALQQRLNKEFEAQYANDTFDRAAPANEVKLAVRNSIAEQMDEINKAVTGLDASPYSDIGSLIEFKGNLNKTLQNIQRAEARTKTGIGSSKSTAIPTSKAQALFQTKKSLLSPFQKTQLEKLDSNVSKIFTKGERAGEALALDPAVQQALIEKYGARPTPPPLPEVVVPLPTFEQQLQEVIQQLPKSSRGANAAQDRAIAEAILRSQQ